MLVMVLELRENYVFGP